MSFPNQISLSSALSSSDQLIISFTLPYQCFVKPAITYHESLILSNWRIDSSSDSLDQKLIFDSLVTLRPIVNTLNDSYSTFGILILLNESRISNGKLTVSIIGNTNKKSEMNDIKLNIFQNYSQLLVSKINLLPIHQINGQVKVELLNFISNVSNFNQCSIYIEYLDSFYQISIVGQRDIVKVVENKINLFLDNMNPQIFSDYLELQNISVLPLICGTNLATINRIINQSNVNIYLPNLSPELFYLNSLDIESNNPKIYLTGLRSQVLLVKKWLDDMITKFIKNPFMKQLIILPTKREFLILEQINDQSLNFFDNLMYNNSCYISVPPLGYKSQDLSGDILTVQGNSSEEVENLVDDFSNKISTYYSEKVEFTLSTSLPSIDINNLLAFNDSLSFNSNCFSTCTKINDKFVFQIMGNSDNIKIATNHLNQFSSIMKLPISQNVHVQYQIELPNKEKDFIAGKKNGKIIKIINMSSVSIKLLPFNDSNFIVEITGTDLFDSLLGLNLLEDELPTIYQFNVPESFHRQIIGVAGQTIQIIMRKFNVFVKFSNSFELSDKALDSQHLLQSTNFQQSFIRKKNVIIKCPSKNKSEIPLAKLELEKLVDKVKKNSYSCSVVTLTLQQWNLLTSYELNMLYNVNRKKPTNFITELEKKTNTFIQYPSLNTIMNNQEFVKLEIYGIENNSKICSLELNKIIPYCFQFKFRKDLRFMELKEILIIDKIKLFQSDEFTPLQLIFLNNIVVPMKLLFNVEVDVRMSQEFDSIVLYYYPHSFGFTYNVINPERLSMQLQNQITSSAQFSQIISGMNKFINDWSFQLIDSETIDTELLVEDLGYHHYSTKQSHQHTDQQETQKQSSSQTQAPIPTPAPTPATKQAQLQPQSSNIANQPLNRLLSADPKNIW